jgi:hypothetical protein
MGRRMMVSLVDATASGDRRQALEALRHKLATELDSSSGHGTASLAKELRELLLQIDQLPVAEGSKVDDLGARRTARRAKAAGS